MNAARTAQQVELRVREFAPLVKRIAGHMMGSLPASVDAGDIIQSGMIGLLDAAKRFDDSQGPQFATYAAQRIRGAMLDGLRECDWVPRRIRRSLRELEKMISRLEQQDGRPPTEAELAAGMDMSLHDYQRLLLDAHGCRLVSYEDFSDDADSFLGRYTVDHESDPLRILENQGMREALIEGIENLPEREKLMMGLYYEQELTFVEIGNMLGVSESRVCQIHTQTIARLRAALSDSL